jgi:hypothetical protein
VTLLLACLRTSLLGGDNDGVLLVVDDVVDDVEVVKTCLRFFPVCFWEPVGDDAACLCCTCCNCVRSIDDAIDAMPVSENDAASNTHSAMM